MAFFLNLSFTLIEIVGGLWTQSVAILADAVHDLGDSLSLGLSWYFQRLSRRPQDQHFTFGYQRFALLGAVVNGMVLILGSILVLMTAVPRLWAPEQPETGGMIALAVVGILVNGLAVLHLRGGHSLNSRMAALHLLEDVLGWGAVLVGAIVMRFVDWPTLDPLLSIGITTWVLFQVYKNLRGAFTIFLQGVPEGADSQELKAKLEALPAIDSVHDLHLWTLDGSETIFSAHLRLCEAAGQGDEAQVREQVRQLLAEVGIHHSTLQVEAAEEPCPMRES